MKFPAKCNTYLPKAEICCSMRGVVDVSHLRNTRGRRPRLNPLGQQLYKLMEAHGVGTSQQLADLLQSKGYDYQRQSISDYASGKTLPRGKFLEAVADVLELSKEEQEALAWGYAYGQG